jgi:hypothetical protein
MILDAPADATGAPCIEDIADVEDISRGDSGAVVVNAFDGAF